MTPAHGGFQARLAVLAAVCGGAVHAAGHDAGGEFTPADWVAYSAAVLKIEAVNPQGGYSLGSGVVLAPEIVATNCHVTHASARVHVVRGGVRWLASAQWSDSAHDVCVLKVPGLKATVVPIGSTQQLRSGDVVHALGHTLGQGLQRRDGRVVALHALDGGRVVQSTNFFHSGASGGGLFDTRGRLVALLTFRQRGPGAEHYYSSPVEWLQPLLAPGAAATEPPSPLPWQGDALPYWMRSAAQRPAFLQPEEGR